MTPRSHTLTSRVSLLGAGLGVAALAAFVPISAASAAVSQGAGCTGSAGTVTCEFYAVNGTVAVPGSATPMPVMGYSDSATGAPILPGPSIVATVGDVVTVKLHNALTAPAQPTGLLFQEQAMAPDTTGIAAGNPTASITYTFTPTAAGTYLYEASPFVKTTGGGGSQYQAAMGMSGALVVRPASAGQAYADPGTAYDTEHLVVVSELDRALTASNAATFDMRNYAPDYYLINGKASPQTADLPAAAGQKVLLRYVNAGIKAHSMGLLGLEEQKVVGEDGNALDNPRRMVAETLGAGQTDDVIVDLPADASGKYPVYDAGMAMNNNGAAGMGGMLTFLSVGAPAGGLPATSNVRVVGTDLLADVSGGATQARYFVDQITGAGTDMGTPSGGTFTASISTHPGSHTFYVQGSADGVTWGPVSSVIYTSADTTGPTTKSLNLSPNPSNGSAAVLLKATGDDSASGGSDITAGHYTIDGPVLSPTDLNGLTTTNMTPNAAAPVAALDTTIPASTVAGLSEGDHTVRVYSRDSAGNWGAATPIMITRDTTGPAGSSPTALPNPNNGTNAFSTSVQAVRVTGSFTDAPSGIAAGEGFIDSAGATGTGFPLVPTDGTFGSPTEILRADIPLATIKALAQGNHAILLRGKDGAGNWGATISTPLVIDKTGPGVTALTAADVPGNFTSVTLTATAADPGATSPVNRAEWFSGTDPGVGNGSPVTVSGAGPNYSLSTTIDFATQGWAFAPRTISVRARDALGNWGAPVSITVSPDLIFANAFASGNASAWSGTTNGGGGRITFPGGTANMPSSATGSAMQVALAGSASYLTDNSPVAEPTYHGRFYFNPNASSPGNSAAGIGIFAGYTANNGGGTTRFVVRYRLSGAQRQVALEVACTTITAQPACTGGVRTTPFVTVSTATPIEVAWTAGASTTASLTVGATTMSLTPLNTGAANRIESVRLGEVLNPAGTGNPRFDSFASHRRTVVGP